MDSSYRLDPAILGYYERRPEESRLERGLSQLEAERTRSLLQRVTRTTTPWEGRHGS